MITYNFQEYNSIFENKKKNYFSSILFILLIIGIIIIVCKYKFYIYEKSVLLNENNSYSLIVNTLEVDKLKRKGNIYINNKKYKYVIASYSNDLENINGTLYETINLDLNYSSSSKAIECYFLKSKKTLLNLFIDYIRGG